MRILTCFMPPTEGRATVAGYDCLEQSMDVKRRIGYSGNPPVYQEPAVEGYLRFVGGLRGWPAPCSPPPCRVRSNDWVWDLCSTD